MTLLQRLYAAQQKDAEEMKGIYAAVSSGVPPDAACASVVGGEFRLSESVQTALKG